MRNLHKTLAIILVAMVGIVPACDTEDEIAQVNEKTLPANDDELAALVTKYGLGEVNFIKLEHQDLWEIASLSGTQASTASAAFEKAGGVIFIEDKKTVFVFGEQDEKKSLSIAEGFEHPKYAALPVVEAKRYNAEYYVRFYEDANLLGRYWWYKKTQQYNAKPRGVKFYKKNVGGDANDKFSSVEYHLTANFPFSTNLYAYDHDNFRGKLCLRINMADNTWAYSNRIRKRGFGGCNDKITSWQIVTSHL